MKDNVFEFKGMMFERVEDGRIKRVGVVPDYRPHNATEEIIPDHIRMLNKKQLRARILELEDMLRDRNG